MKVPRLMKLPEPLLHVTQKVNFACLYPKCFLPKILLAFGLLVAYSLELSALAIKSKFKALSILLVISMILILKEFKEPFL